MAEELAPLRQLLEGLCRGKEMHICVHDISGVLQSPALVLPDRFQVHATAFCDAAKATPRGYRACMRCKTLANDRAQQERALFYGPCCYGVFKVAQPVAINGRVACIVYLSNLSAEPVREARLRESACRFTGASLPRLQAEAEAFEPVTELEPYLAMARLVAGYIQALYRQSGQASAAEGHWAVDAIRRYAEASWQQTVRLEDVARLYHINSQYAGRLFRRQMGCSFHAYLNRLRLARAARQLQEERNKTVLDVALDCGFPTITYFNRLFLRAYGQSPTAYRQAAAARQDSPAAPPAH